MGAGMKQARYWRYMEQRRRQGLKHPFVTKWWQNVNHRLLPYYDDLLAKLLGDYALKCRTYNNYIDKVNPHRKGLKRVLAQKRQHQLRVRTPPLRVFTERFKKMYLA
jgi:hypothetical protein